MSGAFHRHSARLCRLPAMAVTLVPLLVGCSLGEPTPTERSATTTTTPAKKSAVDPVREEFLTETNVEKYQRGSPERAVFDFWLKIQYRDLLSAYESLTPEFRDQFAGSLRRFGNYVMADYRRWLVRPRLMFVRLEGNEATVGLTYRNSVGVSERSSLSLRRSPTGWAIAYDFYLANRLTAK